MHLLWFHDSLCSELNSSYRLDGLTESMFAKATLFWQGLNSMSESRAPAFHHLPPTRHRTFATLLHTPKPAEMVEIPLEIMELFFYHLNGMNQRKTYLKTCCLVSQQWRSISQPLLFSIIDLETTAEVIQSLARAVTQSPHLIAYVDLFRIYD